MTVKPLKSSDEIEAWVDFAAAYAAGRSKNDADVADDAANFADRMIALMRARLVAPGGVKDRWLPPCFFTRRREMMIEFQGTERSGGSITVSSVVFIDPRTARFVREGGVTSDGEPVTVLDIEIGDRCRTLGVLGEVSEVAKRLGFRESEA